MVDKRKAAALFVLFMILAAAAIIVVIRRVRVKTYSYDTVDAVFRNPMMGFAPNADYLTLLGIILLYIWMSHGVSLSRRRACSISRELRRRIFWIHGVRREKGCFQVRMR